ncbi:MAG: S8 family serine peptidase [Bernardetiaceae bacterium]|nr:S8 family serine peptidase [Bernardetiaceae bacterium]
MALPVWGQAPATKYWIYFTDKPTQGYDYRQHLSPQAIENRQKFGLPLVQLTDMPLAPAYVQGVREVAAGAGTGVVCQSKWLNAVSVRMTAEQAARCRQLPYVKAVEPMGRRVQVLAASAADPTEYGSALEQIGANAFAQAGLSGEGVVVGVIDAGFLGANENPYLQHLFDQQRILGVRDMLNPLKINHFSERETSSDDHGNTVLQMITGVQQTKKQYGLATNARFYLARTDHGDREFRAEEDYWVTSMEWMDSLGVRLINTSLGYANGFDKNEDNYQPSQMDGKTSVVSRAAQIAADDKGILLVVSAGNEGSEFDWQVVSAPADAQGVLSVGALSNQGLKAYYSSIGPAQLPYLKPNVACSVQLMAGTSFSAPVITGFAACLMQAQPNASSKQIFAMIEQCGTLYPFGNNYVGYGTPLASRALQYIHGRKPAPGAAVVKAKGQYDLQLKAVKDAKALVFHKINERTVVAQDLLSPKKGRYKIMPREGATRTTVAVAGQVLEIVWQ